MAQSFNFIITDRSKYLSAFSPDPDEPISAFFDKEGKNARAFNFKLDKVLAREAKAPERS